LEENIRKVKLSTPDYRDMDPEVAVADFRHRRELYLRVYEPVADEDGPYIKIINSKQFIGKSASANRLYSFLSSCSLSNLFGLFSVSNIRGYLPLKV
jgi:6-phosphofructo-2-kinase / fructose-2,6-biphosphatase 4